MPDRKIALLVLVAALAALAATGAWAAVRASDSGSASGRYGWMMQSGGMMSYTPGPTVHRVTGLADAKRLAQRFADRLGLKADEVLQFERNYYVKLVDGKGHGASEVLVDPQTGTVSLEYGPAMMWNTRYGMHGRGSAGMMGSYGAGMMGGGMMGGSGSGMMGGSGYGGGMMGGGYPSSNATASVGENAARAIAQRWLDDNGSDLRAESGGDAFPGYYTFEVLRGGRIDGMISVNAFSGAVIYHWWHGAFVAKLGA
jgi:hypothetical protein